MHISLYRMEVASLRASSGKRRICGQGGGETTRRDAVASPNNVYNFSLRHMT